MNWQLTAAITLGLAGSLGWLPEGARAQGGWLDESAPASWNEPGMGIPVAPARETGSARCRQSARPPQSAEERAVVDRGWDLVGAPHEGSGMVVLMGTANYDGMCRWWEYQAFVFVDGVFAGTLSPQPMDSRTDGALNGVSVQANDRLTAQYERYTDADPLCCPTRTTTVEFEIETMQGGPVARPVTASTSPAG